MSTRTKLGKRGITMGELVAAFYEEAHRLTHDDEEADRLARASLMHALRWGHIRTRRRA